MKSIYKITLLVGIMMLASSCHNNSAPNYQYFPNMYESVGYETYSESNAFKNGKEGQLPPDGTIKRGFEVYEYENSTAGYELAKLNSKSPLDTISEKEVAKSKELFEIYCAICHGNEGNGKGKLVTQGKFLGVPSYKDRVITEGSVYHVQTYGLNSMGSYANQLNQHERWLIASYVINLKSKL
ncbi:c-type cytochrome [Flavobacterium restrictum]|jgi:cytochrome c|uniref:Cytochrome c n=1 Tax=Flavobacterium restrictum TaxID=2594428 RepID=A0A553DW48_9FLAO|nr:cytochrome c [Flavobacterium restrictum]TRX37035.1 cytochrome c [Flavobacterium restrictum]